MMGRVARSGLAIIAAVGLSRCNSSTAPTTTDLLVVTPTTATLQSGTQFQFFAVVVDSQGNPLPDAVRWSSSDPSIAKVDENGLAAGVARGNTFLVARSQTLATLIPVGVYDRIGVTGRPFGIDVTTSGVVLVTRADFGSLGRIELPQLALDDSITVGLQPTGLNIAPGGTTAYLTNQFSQNVGVVDVATRSQTATIPVHGDPFVVLVSANGTRVYATTGNTDSVFVIDPASKAVIAAIAVPAAPNGLALHPTNPLLYVSASFGAAVVEVNTATNTVRRTFSLPGSAPQGLVISPDGTQLYVADEAGRLLELNVASGAVAWSTVLPAGGFGVALAPDGASLYVTLPAAGKVVVVSRQGGAILRTLDLGGAPRRIAFHAASGTAAVANESGSVDFLK